MIEVIDSSFAAAQTVRARAFTVLLLLFFLIFVTCAAKACRQNVVGAESDAPDTRPQCLFQLSWTQCSGKLSYVFTLQSILK